MATKNRTETKTLTPEDFDLAPDGEDIARTQALESQLIGPGIEYQGRQLNPISAGTFALMQRAGMKIVWGDTSALLCELAGFILLHDEATATAARRAIYSNEKTAAFDEMVFQFLEKIDSSNKFLTDYGEAISGQIAEYWRTETQQIGEGAGAVGKPGDPIG
jgi:hypothetical protein